MSSPFTDDLEIPELVPYQLDVPSPRAVAGAERGAHDATITVFAATIVPGTITVGAGSRGLAGRVGLARGAIAAIRELGAEPFVEPSSEAPRRSWRVEERTPLRSHRERSIDIVWRLPRDLSRA